MRIIAIAAAFGAERQANQLYARISHFRTLCDDLQEVLDLYEALPDGRQSSPIMADYDRLIADLVGELRQYLQHADEWMSRSPQDDKGAQT